MATQSAQFSCTRSWLILFNLFYIILAVILISVSAYAKSISLVSNDIIGGILACGVFLLVLAVMGLVGTAKHHQVLLFFYMVILFLLFVIQFIIGAVSLGFSYHVQSDLLEVGWNSFKNETKQAVETQFKCCGFKNITARLEETNCTYATSPCFNVLEDSMKTTLRLTGAIGLTFSFFQIIGVFMAAKYRNQRNPKWNPREFL